MRGDKGYWVAACLKGNQQKAEAARRGAGWLDRANRWCGLAPRGMPLQEEADCDTLVVVIEMLEANDRG